MPCKDLDLEIEDGSFVALLGPSGCGKSTTMNMLSGLLEPTRGEMLFDGKVVNKLKPGDRNIGFVFQNYAIFTHMSAFDNIAFGLRVRKRPANEIDQEVREVAQLLGIEEVLDRRTIDLSVNDLQKVAIGRSMITKPGIFLLDEPFSNLDAGFRSYMRAELKKLQRELEQTMIYVTHDQVEAMSMAERIAIMDRGRLQQYGTPDEVYNQPANRFVAGFVGSTMMNFLPTDARPLRRRPRAHDAGRGRPAGHRAQPRRRRRRATRSRWASAPSTSSSSTPARTNAWLRGTRDADRGARRPATSFT